ncbi:MAG: E3 ubiquitin ligase family protein [Candidatus Omnitrophica bacterium]|nr:E3 ubiquitin ligase family protein [Candidatus Omnitrophota bacterium]MBU1924289.1 E3 ubiquitin ligase family protein [Candidatus Omnitrophota bacterium]
MARDDRDIVFALFGFGFGIWSFFNGFKRLRRKRRIENVPTSTVRGLALGMVELTGKAKKTNNLVSPLTNTPCVYYRYLVQRYERRGKSSQWVTVARGDSVFSPFWLDDETGKIMVFPKGAEVILPKDYEFTTGWGKTLPNCIVEFMQQKGIRHKSLFGNHTMRFREWYICPEETVFVLGSARKMSNFMDEHKNKLIKKLQQLKNDPERMKEVDLNHDGEVSIEEWDLAVKKIEEKLLEEELKDADLENASDLMISFSEDEKLFLISDRSEKDLLKKLGWEAVLGIWGGAALTLAAFAYLLFRLKPIFTGGGCIW